MSSTDTQPPFVAIACGGTGGHLFPGLAVAEQLQKIGCSVGLLISPKEVDQQAVRSVRGLEIFTLPAVGLQNGNYFSFAHSFGKSFLAARKIFRRHRPDAVLAMGGFTSAPPILAATLSGARTFLHESNTIPGKANRLAGRFVDAAFVSFPAAGSRLPARKIFVTGTPVRPQFQPRAASECRAALGLAPEVPTILVVGGSQGASGLNEMVLSVLPRLANKNWQWLHLTGIQDFEKVKAGYAAHGLQAVVKKFVAEMDLALGAATVCLSRSGASSLAEIAALRLPSLLVPFPAAADNHQMTNALAFEKTGAAQLLEQKNSPPEKIALRLTALMADANLRSSMQAALGQWHTPRAAEQIAGIITQAILQPAKPARMKAKKCRCGHAHGPAKPAH